MAGIPRLGKVATSIVPPCQCSGTSFSPPRDSPNRRAQCRGRGGDTIGPTGPASSGSARARWRRWGFQLPHQGGPPPVHRYPASTTPPHPTTPPQHQFPHTPHTHTHTPHNQEQAGRHTNPLHILSLPPIRSKPRYTMRFHTSTKILGTETPISSKTRPPSGWQGETTMECHLLCPMKRNKPWTIF